MSALYFTIISCAFEAVILQILYSFHFGSSDCSFVNLLTRSASSWDIFRASFRAMHFSWRLAFVIFFLISSTISRWKTDRVKWFCFFPFIDLYIISFHKTLHCTFTSSCHSYFLPIFTFKAWKPVTWRSWIKCTSMQMPRLLWNLETSSGLLNFHVFSLIWLMNFFFRLLPFLPHCCGLEVQVLLFPTLTSYSI